MAYARASIEGLIAGGKYCVASEVGDFDFRKQVFMKHSTPLAAALSVLSMLLVACADQMEPVIAQHGGRADYLAAAPGVSMVGYRFDAPSPRPWDSDPGALTGPLDSANGRLIVSFKSPSAERAILAGGQRGSLQADDFDRGIAAVLAVGGTVERSWPRMGAALVRVSAAAGAELMASPLVDFVDPDVPQAVSEGMPGAEAALRNGAALVNAAKAIEAFPKPTLDLYGNAELDANWSIANASRP